MADNTTNNLTVRVKLTTKVPSALARRFVKYQNSSGQNREVITLVPTALGYPAPVGILAEDIDTNQADGYYAAPMVMPGGLCEVLCGEAWNAGDPLRAGGNSTETDGAAYLANATGDIIVGYAMSAGVVGEYHTINFLGFAGTAP